MNSQSILQTIRQNPAMPRDARSQARLLAAAPAMLAELIQCEKDLECLYAIALESGARAIGSFPPHKRVREVIDLATVTS